MKLLRHAGCVLALAACQEDGGDSPEQRLPSEMAAAACEASSMCECHASLDDCVRGTRIQFQDGQNLALAAGATFDASCYERHLDTIHGLGCEPLSEGAVDSFERCQIYHGEKMAGEPCLRFDGTKTFSSMSDCAQGLTCGIGARCVPNDELGVELAAGDACIDEQNAPLGLCPAGQACDLAGKTCVMPAAVGEPCPANYPCLDSWCEAEVCSPRKAMGSACMFGNECESGNCYEERCIEGLPTACFASSA